MLKAHEVKFGHGTGEDNVEVIEHPVDQPDVKVAATFTEAQPMTIEYPESTELYFAPLTPPK